MQDPHSLENHMLEPCPSGPHRPMRWYSNCNGEVHPGERLPDTPLRQTVPGVCIVVILVGSTH